MSLELSGSDPKVEVKTYGVVPEMVILTVPGKESVDIPISDFLAMAWYVLTNTDLYKDDPRIPFVNTIKELKQLEGHDPGRKRLAVDKNSWSLVYRPILTN